MRWVNDNSLTKGIGALVLLLGLQSVGCTPAVVQAGADDPRAFALLPVAVIGDLIASGLRGGKSSRPNTPPDPSLASWEDPEDWVGECEGPLLCDAPRQFACYGSPGDCYCACELPLTATSASQATAMR